MTEDAADSPRPSLLAVRVSTEPMTIRPAAAQREWMNVTPDGFARRCQPMVLASQNGWELINPVDVKAVWDGSPHQHGTTVSSDSSHISSHFGSGIITWSLPFLFRTPKGVDLLLRGPANSPIDGASPLEGLIEADWSPATATMNWKLTRPGLEVHFPADAPIAMVVPMSRGYLESYRAVLSELGADEEFDSEYLQWRQSREDFLKNDEPHSERIRGWQGDYFRGRIGTAKGGRRKGRSRLELSTFTDTT